MYEIFADRKRKLIFLDKTESTNNDLKFMIRNSSEPVFAVISANRQEGGRGRLGRVFLSPEGGLYFSASFPLTGNENNIPFLTLLAGLAASDAIKELTGVQTQLKWPNDIFLNGKKLGGILCELIYGKIPTAVVGIGINLTAKKEDFPESLKDTAASFFTENIDIPEKSLLARRITERLDEYIYEKAELFEAEENTLAEIRKRSYSIGKKVKYTSGDNVYEGIITNITKTGAAEISLYNGMVKEIFCGEITQ